MSALNGDASERLRLMQAQRDDAFRVLAILIERAGGEVRISPMELQANRFLERDEIGMTGVTVLRVRKP